VAKKELRIALPGAKKVPKKTSRPGYGKYRINYRRGRGVVHVGRGPDERQQFTAALLYEVLWKQSTGVDIRTAKMRRFAPLRIYIEDDSISASAAERLLKAVWRFVRSVGYTPAYEQPSELGSWRKIAGAISTWIGTEDDAAEKMKTLEAAARTVLLDKPTAEVTEKQAQAAAAVIKELKDYDGASVQFGNMLVVKRTTPDGKKLLISGVLSTSSLQRLEENHFEMLKPENAQTLLEGGGQTTVIDQDNLSIKGRGSADD
jgi:hypothetical protein